MKEYSAYNYKRFRKRRKIFPYIIVALSLCFVLFVVNLFLGLVTFGKKEKAFELPGATFWAQASEEFPSKATALNRSREVQSNGGAGYVLQQPWVVVNEVYAVEVEGAKKFSLEPHEVYIPQKEHFECLGRVCNSFSASFEKLLGDLASFVAGNLRAREVCDRAVIRYNELNALRIELDAIQSNSQSVFYAELMLALNRQLLSIYVLSTEANNPNFIHEIKFAACGVIFAYYDFLNTIQ